MEAIWMVPLAGSIAAAIGLFLSKPERPRWAFVTLLLVLLTGAWQAAFEYSSAQTDRALANRAHRQLAVATNRLFSLLADMVRESTDDWTPKSEDEFFSQQMWSIICRDLDIYAPALVSPPQVWRNHAGSVAADVRGRYRDVLNSSGTYLDAEIVEVVSNVEASLMMTVLAIGADYSHLVAGSTLCHGIEEKMDEALPDLRRLYHLLNQRGSVGGLSVTPVWQSFVHHGANDSRLGRSRMGRQ